MATATKKNVIDLSAMRAVRREAAKEAPEVEFEGKTFVLPVEMPLMLIDAVARLGSDDGAEASSALIDVARSLFGDRFKEFMDLRPSVDDANELIKAIAPAYGLEVGESEASES